MPRVLLIHWNAAEADDRADRLRREGFDVETFSGPGGEAFRALADSSPDAILIDLARLPSHGRAVAIAFRQRKATRAAPLVFIEGEIEKTARARALLPDAVFTTWPKAGAALRRAMRERLAKPLTPDTFAEYSATPLARKLRIREGSVVAVLRAPDGFEAKLEPLPEGVRFVRRASDADVILCFATSSASLGRAFAALTAEMREGQTLWIVWPKRTSALAGDLSQPRVREMGLAAGLVDYKVCAVDETWSGLAFTVRSAKRG